MLKKQNPQENSVASPQKEEHISTIISGKNMGGIEVEKMKCNRLGKKELQKQPV